MPDLEQDLRDYFDALVKRIEVPPATRTPSAVTRRGRGTRIAGAAVMIVGALGAMLVAAEVGGDREEDTVSADATTAPGAGPRTFATATRGGLETTLRLLSPEDGSGTDFIVEATIANVGSEPVAVTGSIEPDACNPFPVDVEAVRVAWEPGEKPWPGADHYLGIDVTGPGWADPDPRGSSFADPLTEQARQEVLDRTGAIICNLDRHKFQLQPGVSASRRFTWAPPDGWPGGRHNIVAAVTLSERLEGTRVAYERLEESVPVDVESTVDDATGPMEGLRALAADRSFRDEIARRGGLLAITTTWTADGWAFDVRYSDGKSASWGARDTAPR